MNEAWLAHHGIPGMKWGVRRYEDKEGHLTEAGKKRYAKEQERNARKKKDNRLPEEGVRDANRWVKEDRTNTKNVVDQARNMTNSMKELERVTNRPKDPKREDLSSMSDADLRALINRELLERQYAQVFNPPTVSRGREYVQRTLEVTGAILGITSSALGIALAIQQLKNG